MEDIVLLQEPEENYKKGYIKLYRSIEDHWISCNPYYYQAFNRLLFRVNHSKNTELIEGEIIDCDRGQSLYSLNSWSDIFNKKLSKKWWTIQKVRTFFKLLQNDNMILVEGLRKTTRVTICNYESYQNHQHRDNTEITDRQHTANTQLTTTKDIKELKELNNLIIDEIYTLYPSKCPVSDRKTGKSIKDKDKIKRLLKSNDSDKLKAIIRNYVADCKKSNTYLKNFSTFLNNLPDEEPETNGELKYRFRFKETNYTTDLTMSEFKKRYPDMTEQDYDFKRI